MIHRGPSWNKWKITRLDGLPFGRLVVQSTWREDGVTWCMALCQCGELVKVRAQALKARDCKSCGCLRREVMAGRNKLKSA